MTIGGRGGVIRFWFWGKHCWQQRRPTSAWCNWLPEMASRQFLAITRPSLLQFIWRLQPAGHGATLSATGACLARTMQSVFCNLYSVFGILDSWFSILCVSAMQMVASGLAGRSIMQCNSFPVVQARMLPARLEHGEQGEQGSMMGSRGDMAAESSRGGWSSYRLSNCGSIHYSAGPIGWQAQGCEPSDIAGGLFCSSLKKALGWAANI